MEFEFLADWYLWTKALHILSVISWMAGMLYLPRLFVYHVDAEKGSVQSETFKIMERRLLRGIINPAMGATFLFGILLALTPSVIDWSMVWPWAKLFFLFLMTGFHGGLSKWRREFEKDENSRSTKFYRLANEVPTVLLIFIVITIVVKPF